MYDRYKNHCRTYNQTDTSDAIHTVNRLHYTGDYDFLNDRPSDVSEARWKAMINHIMKHGYDHID